MPVYLVDSGAGEIWVGEVERKLKPVIPALLRAPKIEDIGDSPMRSAEPSFVILVAPSAAENHLASLVETAARYSGKLYFIAVGGDISAKEYKKLIQSGNADWVAENGAP